MVSRSNLTETMKNAFREMLDNSGVQVEEMLSRKFMYAIKDETEFFQAIKPQ